MSQVVFVTGGAGFIGSAVIRHLISTTDATVINIDKLTYAANLETLDTVSKDPRYKLEVSDICDREAMDTLFDTYRPSAVMHLAAESHVDRSIDGPAEFINTNIVGTFSLLEAGYKYWQTLDEAAKQAFRFLHVSTDEVYGSLPDGEFFTEDNQYQPNSPYSASKASSDHLVRAWRETYGFPTLITNCTNNYGPYQFPEKLLPVVILKILNGEKIPVYGKGDNVRDWLFVDDHADALWQVLMAGRIGETYCIGGNSDKQNIEVVRTVCEIMNDLVPSETISDYRDLIEFVVDRPGHDQRYAMDISKIKAELGWEPRHNFEQGLRDTIQWYLDNRDWWQKILDNKHQGQRLGTSRG